MPERGSACDAADEVTDSEDDSEDANEDGSNWQLRAAFGAAPVRQPGESWKAAFNAWFPHRDDRAVEMMAHEQNHSDNQRLARNGTKANRARKDACDSDSDAEHHGDPLNISDDERDAGLEASTDASTTRPVSPKLAAFTRACRSHGAAPSTVVPTAEVVDLCNRHSAAPSNAAWERRKRVPVRRCTAQSGLGRSSQ